MLVKQYVTVLKGLKMVNLNLAECWRVHQYLSLMHRAWSEWTPPWINSPCRPVSVPPLPGEHYCDPSSSVEKYPFQLQVYEDMVRQSKLHGWGGRGNISVKRAEYFFILFTCFTQLQKTCMRDKGVKNVLFNLVTFTHPY